MTEPKMDADKEEMDWADALDEWEQKAFSSIVPPAPSAPPPAGAATDAPQLASPSPHPSQAPPAMSASSPSSLPRAPRPSETPPPPHVDPFAQAASARISAPPGRISVPPGRVSVPPPSAMPSPTGATTSETAHDDRTLASSAEGSAAVGAPASTDHQVTYQVTGETVEEAAVDSSVLSAREVELEDDDMVIEEAANVPLPSAAPPLPDMRARPSMPRQPPPAPSIRFEDAAPKSIEAPRVSVVTGALQALASLQTPASDEAAVSRIPMPSVREVSADVKALLHEQATWLEAEAASAAGAARAGICLALSEIKAITGDRSGAARSAAEARDLAPDLVLAHQQARALVAPTNATEAAALIAEEAATTIPAARQHAALLAADLQHIDGHDAAALRTIERVSDTGDLRGLVGRIALGLAHRDAEALTAIVARPDVARMPGPLADGLTAALRLRGVPVPSRGTASSPEGVSDALRDARHALSTSDFVAAATHIAGLRAVPELLTGAGWLAAALAATKEEGRARAVSWLDELARRGDPRASRALAARAVEADDGAAATAALAHGGFSPADEISLSALLEVDARPSLDALPDEMRVLGAAVASMEPGLEAGDDDARHQRVEARAACAVGSDASRAAGRVARLLAANASSSQLAAGIDGLRATSPDVASVLELELALREGAHADVSDRLRAWSAVAGSQGRPVDAQLAAGLVAERAGDVGRALSAYRDARGIDRASEVALRAVASLQASTDLPGELNDLAEELGATVHGALTRLEAVIREDSVDDATRTELLERSHRAAPALPLAPYLAERIALRGGHVDDVLRWITDRRATGNDATELVVDALREARLISPRDPETSVARIADAHHQMPHDLALRYFHERTRRSVPDDGARYWESEAATTVGDAQARIYLEVAHSYERSGDSPGTLRALAAATAATDGGTTPGVALVRLARERAELEAGEAAQLVDQLLGESKTTTDATTKREAYERLADIDGVGRGDTVSALMWHKAILEDDETHLPSLRHLEHALIGEGRDDDLEPIATLLAQRLVRPDATDGGERVAHADLAARLRGRGPEGDWDSTFKLAELAAADRVPSLNSLRLLHAHARNRKDDALLITASEQLLERATRPVEMAALRLRLAEAAYRGSDLAAALTNLERSTMEDPGDLVAFRLLAEVRHTSGDYVGAAEAHESVARLSLVPGHQLDAWYDAARLWLGEGDNREQGMLALEHAAAINLAHEDVFSRLSTLYSEKGAHADLAALLEKRIDLATDPDERVTYEVERGRALLASGDRGAARQAIVAALNERPDHTTALATFGDISALDEDWPSAEDAWVRLARLLVTPDEQREVYERLGDLYSSRAVHLERAELALKEVLRRSPRDLRSLERLVDVYRRQPDVSRALEVQQELVSMATTPADKRDRTITIARLHEDPGHDEKKAEQVLESMRREFPTDVVVLRALAEFYLRHKQTPAMNILLDRAAADARRAFAAGRFAPALFEVMGAVFDIRGQDDAARLVGASLLAIEGRPADIRGAFGPALDTRVDDSLAPDVLTPGLRTLLSRAGSRLDLAAPIDLRGLAAQPAGADARLVHDLASSFAAGLGMPTPKIYVSKTVGRTCLPGASDPPSLVIGELLLGSTNERAVAFIVMRAMKLIAARASALVRTTSTDLAALVPAWLQVLAPSWTPQGVNPTSLAAATRKFTQGDSPPLDADLTALAVEVASQLGTRASTLGALALAWANRSALLGVGDPNAALEAMAWSLGNKDGAPTDPVARAGWIGRTHEAKDLLIFSVGDGYAEARAKLELSG